VSYFTLRTIIVLMETMKDFYSSTTIPPSAAVATRRCDLRVYEYTAYTTRRRRLSSITRAPCRKGDGRARPALAGCAEGGERHLVVLDTGDVFHNAFAVRAPGIDAEGEVRSSPPP
jgi:hypothetical protein